MKKTEVLDNSFSIRPDGGYLFRSWKSAGRQSAGSQGTRGPDSVWDYRNQLLVQQCRSLLTLFNVSTSKNGKMEG